MAIGDILNIECLGNTDHNGWVLGITIDSWSGGTNFTMSNGFGYNNNPSTANLFGVITSKSHDVNCDPSIITRNYRGTKIIRKAYPNNSSLDVTTTGIHAYLKVAIDTVIYQKDKSGDGNSGVDVSYSLATGTFSCDLGFSNYATGWIINNSTREYPEPFGSWVRTANYSPRRAVSNPCEIGFMPRCYRGRANSTIPGGIAAVKFIASGISSGAGYSTIVTGMTAVYCTGSSLYYNAHIAQIDLTSMLQGEQISIDTISYPIIGDRVFNTRTYLSGELAHDRGTEFLTCNKTDALTVYAAVDGVGASPALASGVNGESTARSTPYATVAAALNAGGNVIVLESGVHNIFGAAITSSNNNFWKVIRAANGVDRTNVHLQFTSTAANHQYKTNYLCIRNCSIMGGTSNSYFNGENTRSLWIDQCYLHRTGGIATNPTAPIGYQGLVNYFTDNFIATGGTLFNIGASFSTTRSIYIIIGNNYLDTFGGNNVYKCVANKGINSRNNLWTCSLGSVTSSIPPVYISGIIIENNLCLNGRSASAPFISEFYKSGGLGLSFQGNMSEIAQNQIGAHIGIAADSSIANADHILINHNTIMGQRSNLGYNSIGSVRYSRDNWEQIGNLMNQWNNKDDLFGTPDGNRTGGWQIAHGVDSDDLRYESLLFPADWQGSNVITKSLSDVVREESYWNDGAYVNDDGNGDYTPFETGNLYQALNVTPGLKYDLFGNDITVGRCIGGIQFIIGSSGELITIKGLGLSLKAIDNVFFERKVYKYSRGY